MDHETGRTVSGASVALLGLDRRTLTDAAGRFSFPDLVPATYRLEFRGLGYRDRVEALVLAEGQVLTIEVRLSPQPVDLPPIAVTIRTDPTIAWLARRGFAQRGSQGNAMLHVNRRNLTQQGGRNLNDVLRRVPGVRIRRLVDSGSELLLEPSPLPGGAPCRVGIYLNGSNVELGRFNWTGALGNQRASRPVRLDDILRLSEIDGLELYGPDDNPVASDSTCGALLLWSSTLRPTVDEEFTGSIRGMAVNDETGAVLPGVRVTIQPGGLTAETDSAGRFEIPSLVPGEYQLSADYPNATPWRATVTVKAYGNVELELRLTMGQTAGVARSQAADALPVPVGSPTRRLAVSARPRPR